MFACKVDYQGGHPKYLKNVALGDLRVDGEAITFRKRGIEIRTLHSDIHSVTRRNYVMSGARAILARSAMDVALQQVQNRVAIECDIEGLRRTLLYEVKTGLTIFATGKTAERLLNEIETYRASWKAEPTVGSVSLADELERLSALRDKGVLNDAEFQQAKVRLLRA